MAKIDVSQLMLDPDFCDSLQLIRRTYTVNNYGENTTVETTSNVYGSMQSARKEDVARIPDGVAFNDFKTFYTKTPLRTGDATNYPDQIVWGGERYQVENVINWGNFGAGWYMCDCVRVRDGQ